MSGKQETATMKHDNRSEMDAMWTLGPKWLMLKK